MKQGGLRSPLKLILTSKLKSSGCFYSATIVMLRRFAKSAGVVEPALKPEPKATISVIARPLIGSAVIVSFLLPCINVPRA